MPIYEPDHVEYSITSGIIQIVLDDGRRLPAYWAHPTLGSKFPGVTIIHDWWGLTFMIRRMANLFAQMGHYVIVPDLFGGRTANSAAEAMALFDETKETHYSRVNDALSVLENHHQCNKSVAAVGVGMGGTLAFEAAIMRGDLEAAVAYSGFPQRFLGSFNKSNTPICAFFGAKEQHVPASAIEKMRNELAGQTLPHEIHIIEELGHEFFSEELTESQRQRSRSVLKYTFDFLDGLLQGPTRQGDRYVF